MKFDFRHLVCCAPGNGSSDTPVDQLCPICDAYVENNSEDYGSLVDNLLSTAGACASCIAGFGLTSECAHLLGCCDFLGLQSTDHLRSRHLNERDFCVAVQRYQTRVINLYIQMARNAVHRDLIFFEIENEKIKLLGTAIFKMDCQCKS